MSTYTELAGLMVQMKKLDDASSFIQKAKSLCQKMRFDGAIPRINLREAELLEAQGKAEEAKEKFLLANTSFRTLDENVNAEYATTQATNIENRPLTEWIWKVMNGQYNAEIGLDGLTDAERLLNPFVGKKVRVVVNQGKWPGTTTTEVMRIVYEGIFYKSDYKKRLNKLVQAYGAWKV